MYPCPCLGLSVFTLDSPLLLDRCICYRMFLHACVRGYASFTHSTRTHKIKEKSQSIIRTKISKEAHPRRIHQDSTVDQIIGFLRPRSLEASECTSEVREERRPCSFGSPRLHGYRRELMKLLLIRSCQCTALRCPDSRCRLVIAWRRQT